MKVYYYRWNMMREFEKKNTFLLYLIIFLIVMLLIMAFSSLTDDLYEHDYLLFLFMWMVCMTLLTVVNMDGFYFM